MFAFGGGSPSVDVNAKGGGEGLVSSEVQVAVFTDVIMFDRQKVG